MSSIRSIARGLLPAIIISVPTVAGAQLVRMRADSFPSPRHWVGVDFTVAQPVAQLREFINTGFGANADYVYRVDERGIFGLRVDASYLNYGNEHQRICFNTATCRVQLKVNTTNNIVNVGVGPQLMVPVGPIRPYAAGSIGLSYFFTESSVEGTDDYDRPFASTNNFDDNGVSFTGMAGVLIPVSAGRVPVSLDIGARYHANGERSYLRKGSIVDNGPNQLPTINAIRSQADFVTYHIGVSIGLRPSNHDDRR